MKTLSTKLLPSLLCLSAPLFLTANEAELLNKDAVSAVQAAPQKEIAETPELADDAQLSEVSLNTKKSSIIYTLSVEGEVSVKAAQKENAEDTVAAEQSEEPAQIAATSEEIAAENSASEEIATAELKAQPAKAAE